MLEGKFKCVESIDCDIMITGKTYEFIDGKFKREDGIGSVTYTSFNHFNIANLALAKIRPYIFTKSDLKDGDYVTDRVGTVSIVALRFDMLLDIERGYITISELKDDLTCNSLKNFDIMKIERDGVIIWEREEKSQRDIEIDDIQTQIDVLNKKLDELRKVD